MDDDDDDDFDSIVLGSSTSPSASSSSLGKTGKSTATSAAFTDLNVFREDNKPAGLKNVGNTCWFNSIIQAFFHLPSFRKLILSFGIESEDIVRLDDNSKNVVNFVIELRKLFALMSQSKRRAINPNATLRCLKTCSRYDVETFNQEDVSEFATILVNLIEESFDILFKLQQSKQQQQQTSEQPPTDDMHLIESFMASLDLNKSDSSAQEHLLLDELKLNIANTNLTNLRKNHKNPIVNLLNGVMLISRKNSDEETTNNLLEIFREVNIQMLNSRTLHAGLELEWGETIFSSSTTTTAQNSVDGNKIQPTVIPTSPKDTTSHQMNRSIYEQESWLVKLPEVLFICLNRYKFVKATKSSSKIIEPFEFYPSIYLDR